MRHVLVSDMALRLHPSGRQLVAVLRAYFDKSETHPEGITSVAGYVAPAEEWERVERLWRENLDQWRIPYFHMAELHRTLRVGEEREAMCVGDFRRIIEGSQLDAIGAAVFDADWRKTAWPEMTLRVMPTTYHYCLDAALEALGNHTRQHFPGEDVQIICDADDVEHRIQRVFGFRQAMHEQLFSITIGADMRRVPALQCADLGAGLLRKSWLTIANDPDVDLPWGELPYGRKRTTSIWSGRQGALLTRSFNYRRLKANEQSK